MTVKLLRYRHKGDREKQARDLDIGTEVGKMKSKFRNRAVAMTLAMMVAAAAPAAEEAQTAILLIQAVIAMIAKKSEKDSDDEIAGAVNA